MQQTVPDLLARRVADSPDDTCFREAGDDGQWRAITWRTFNQRVERMRQALHVAGLRRGDRLALIAPTSMRWECLHHAALGLGVVVVGLDVHDTPERVASMVEQIDATGLAVGSPQAIAGIGAARLATCRLLAWTEAQDRPPQLGSGWRNWADLEALAGGEVAAPSVDLQATDLATVIFTSGTTGAPKGIPYTHGQVCLAVDAICQAFRFAGPGTRLLCWLPLSNLFQRMVNLAAIRQGAETYLLGEPRRVMEVVASVAPDIFIAVPRFFEKLHAGLRASLAAQPAMARGLAQTAWSIGRRRAALARAGTAAPWWLEMAFGLADRWVLRRIRAVMGDRLQVMVSGSAPLSRSLLEDLHALGWLVLESYGLSENIVPMAMNRRDCHRLGTVGRPVACNEIQIADDGEILVRGPGLFSGYLAGESAACQQGAGWYATGDLGALDADGFLTLTGRRGDIIKTSTGRRIAPAGVEAVLRSITGIDQALVLGAGRKCPVALCTAAPGSALLATPVAFRDALQRQLAAVHLHDRPAAVAVLPDAFSIAQGELTPNLKLRREVIAQRYADLIDALYAAIDAGQSQRNDVILLQG